VVVEDVVEDVVEVVGAVVVVVVAGAVVVVVDPMLDVVVVAREVVVVVEVPGGMLVVVEVVPAVVVATLVVAGFGAVGLPPPQPLTERTATAEKTLSPTKATRSRTRNTAPLVRPAIITSPGSGPDSGYRRRNRYRA
jgi:hypothetical protein